MINNSKILTVSYGTFSCTLEGFDDSFGTMKAIAEYFRDLAADDRYFGAEPPTPDADMLARIAEREIERRVQAHEDGGKIVLRAEDAAPVALPAEEVAAPVAEAPAAPQEPVIDAPVETVAEAPAPKVESFTAPMPAPVIADVPAAEGVAEADPAPEAPVETFADIAEEPAQEIADEPAEEIAEEAEVDAVEAIELADEISAEEEVAEAPAEVVEEAQPETLADDVEDVVEAADNEIPVAEEAAETTDDAIEVEAAVEDAAEITHPDPDSVAAKLSRIRSVVAQSEQPYGDTDYSEDEHAADFLETNLADLDAALAADDAAELASEDLEAEDEPVDVDVAEEESAAENEIAEVEEVETPEAGEETAEGETEDLDALLANVTAQSDFEAEAEDDDGAEAEDAAPFELAEDAMVQPEEAPVAEKTDIDPIEDTLAQLMADALPEGGPAEDDVEGEAIDDAEEDVAEDRPLNARVIKMKKADIEAALADGHLREADAEDDSANLFSDDDDDDDIESTLSPEEEAELQRELAEVEADFAPEEAEEDIAETEGAEDDAPETFADDAEDALNEALDDASTASARGVDRLQAVDQPSDVSRIFDEADSQLDEPESSERRNAIQHLRAAVAATRADQNAGVDISKDKDDSAYRSDLADVVRPRRPRAGGSARSARPGMERPAPLKLVAEQRIDTPQDPVRPRRITTQDLAEVGTVPPNADVDGSFADFAEEMGAGSLPELLEAAAAYMADVEGRPQFSRPMLMGKLKEVEGDTFSREDGLRSFGQLLRQGKLQKLKGGRFAVTDETDFRAPARNAG